MTIIYRRTFTNGDIIKETNSISAGNEFTFRMPYDTDLSSAYLVVHAVAGSQVMSVKIQKKNDCFTVWGTTLSPEYSRIPC